MKLSGIGQSIKQHPLMSLIYQLKGNPKVCVLIEPFWGIPYNLVAPFVTVYMYAMGVNDVQIGLILSLAMVLRLFLSFSSGIIADRLGRKTTTILGDIIGWVIPGLVWAAAQNFWFFLAAVLLNSFEQMSQTAWSCLLIEDADKRQVVNIYTWITIAGLLAVFFAPISGLLINRFDMVPVVRIIYLIFGVAMIIKCIITYKYTTETEQGRIRKQETKQTSFFKLICEYRDLIPRIFKNKATVQTLIIMVMLYITNMVSTNFFGLYISDTLGISEQYLAYFPIIRAVVMIVFLFGVQHKMRRIKLPMGVGILLFICSQLVLILTPKGELAIVVLYIFLEAVAHGLVMPRKDSMLVNNVEPEERARIVALLTALMIGFSVPFGYIAGLLSGTDRRLPFLFSICLYLIAMAVVSRVKEKDSAKA